MDKVFVAIANASQHASQFAKEHPKGAIAMVAGVVVVGAPALAAAPVLGAAGFTANGIAGGSVAAGLQGGIGSVVAPSLFATLQSAGAGGYGVSAVYGAVQAAGGLTAALGGFSAWLGGGSSSSSNAPDEAAGREAEMKKKSGKDSEAKEKDEAGKEDEAKKEDEASEEGQVDNDVGEEL